jgi:hypothetical protein
VRALWLKRNPIGDEGAKAVARLLSTNRHVRTVDLVNTGLTIDALSAMAEALAWPESGVERLYLGANGFGPECAPAVIELVTSATSLRELYLAANPFGDVAVAEVVGSVPRSAHALRLGLGSCGAGLSATAALAESLERIWWLDLARAPVAAALPVPNNEIGDDGAQTLAARLPTVPPTLLGLDLRGTGVHSSGALAFLAAFERGLKLATLRIGKGVSRRVKRRIAEQLEPKLQPPSHDVEVVRSRYR